MWNNKLIFGSAVILLVGCASMPSGPRVAVMPAPGKPFELFVQEDQICRQYATQSIGQSANEFGRQSFANSAAAGVAIGAVAGGLMGGNDGVASGAGTGLLMGSMIGAGESDYGVSEAQRRYDIAYQQCMYAKGNQLPGQRYQNNVNYPPPPPPQR
jgi:hypothetical protein